MDCTRCFYFLIFILILDILDTKQCCSQTPITKPQCLEAERKTLLDFKDSIQYPSYSSLSWWVGDDCCSWRGIYCSNTTGNVIGIRLHFNLSNTLALDGNVLLPLLSLEQLAQLYIPYNNFSGSRIPKFIGSFKNLNHLDISDCGFTGRIPGELGNLSTLQQLYIGGNEKLDVVDLEWLSKLKSLSFLNMSYVSLKTSSNWLQTLNSLPNISVALLHNCELNSLPPLSFVNLTSLAALDLKSNNINSSLPDWFWKLTSLQFLDISYNSIQGPLPVTIGNLSSMHKLVMSNNNLTGSIPLGIAQMKSLLWLDLKYNSLTGPLSEAHFANMSSLNTLLLSYNFLVFKTTNDWVPPFNLQRLQISECLVGPQFPNWLKTQHSLRKLSLRYSGIEGLVPDWFANLTSVLEYIDLSENKIIGDLSQFFNSDLSLTSGSFPSEVSNNEIVMNHIDLSFNNLSGSIPSLICELKYLEILELADNNFSGVLPNCWNSYSSLSFFDLSFNNFNGEIPQSLCDLSNLTFIHLNRNSLSGSVPPCLLFSKSLLVLDLSQNKLTEITPSSSEESQFKSSSLKVLSLRFNSLTGTIPDLSTLKQLQILDLSNNNLSGSIPPNVGKLRAMAFSRGIVHVNDLSTDGETLIVGMKGQELQYFTKALVLLSLIDLSNNSLTGQIPEELMNLHGLQVLNLSRNELTGGIPKNIDELQQLENLDLSSNDLSGPIPSSLKSLYLLDHLNLSYNNLQGKIPTGNQLQTFDSSSYEGNLDLCGSPLNISCHDEDDGHQGSSDKDGEELIWFYVAVAPGFIVGFWVACGTLILRRKWRIAFFQAVDRVYYKLFESREIEIRS